jgi:hypothetical protein
MWFDRNWGELDALLLNPWAGFILSLLLKRETPFDQATETEWKALLFVAFHNTRLGEKLPWSQYSRFGYNEREFNFDRLTEAAWDVIRNARPNHSWAYALSGLIKRIHLSGCNKPDDETLTNLIDKWRLNVELNDPDVKALNKMLEGRHLERLGCYDDGKPPIEVWSWAFEVRKHLADCLPWNSDLLRQSSSEVDSAVRYSYLNRVPVRSVQMLDDLWAKEGDRWMLEALIGNEWLYKSKDLSDRLAELCRSFDETNKSTLYDWPLLDDFRRESKKRSRPRRWRSRRKSKGPPQGAVLNKRLGAKEEQLNQSRKTQRALEEGPQGSTQLNGMILALRLLGEKLDALALLVWICLILQLLFYFPIWIRAIFRMLGEV